jgi:hypothetical protein
LVTLVMQKSKPQQATVLSYNLSTAKILTLHYAFDVSELSFPFFYSNLNLSGLRFLTVISDDNPAHLKSKNAEGNILRDCIFNRLYFAEEFMRSVVVERKLTIQHCIEQYSQCPHITRFAQVWPTYNEHITYCIMNGIGIASD